MLGMSALLMLLAGGPQFNTDTGKIVCAWDHPSSKRVFEELGEPNSDEKTMCGKDTGAPWDCRIWRYRIGSTNYLLVFTKVDDGWKLNSCRSCNDEGCKPFPFTGE